MSKFGVMSWVTEFEMNVEDEAGPVELLLSTINHDVPNNVRNRSSASATVVSWMGQQQPSLA